MRRILSVLAVWALLLAAAPALAYVEAPMSLGAVVAQSTNIVLMRVEAVDREKNLIIYRKVQDIKGKHPTDVIKHNIGRGGLRPNEWKPQMDWAEPGKTAMFFYNGGASETCIGKWWYQAYAGGEWWNHSHAEPFLLRSFAGPPEKLASIVTAMLAGQETVAPCMVDGNKEDLHARRAKIQRMKVSLKIQDYNVKRDFVGWGGEDFRRVLGMPGFSHLSSLGRADPEAQAISVVDFDGDNKLDLCLIGAGKLSLLQNGGDALSESILPIRAGARAAVWADYNADGKPDVFLATPAGPKLLTNQGGSFRDDSHLLPPDLVGSQTAAAWLDYDGDGLPDLLVADGYNGLRLLRNNGSVKMPKAPQTPVLGGWHFLGPFDNAGNKAFDNPHPLVKGVDLNATWEGRAGVKIGWKPGKFNDGAINDLKLFGPVTSQVAVYLYREIQCPTAVDLPLSLGSDDTLSVWLNGEKILANPSQRAAAPEQDRVTLKLKEGKNQLVLMIGQGDGDWAFYFAAGKIEQAPPRGQAFTDVSTAVGLGASGPGAGIKGDALCVCDVDRDGRPDFLFSAGKGMLFLNRPKGKTDAIFELAKESGISFDAGRVGPAFGDFDGDDLPDLLVPQKNGVKLFRNLGKGVFADVTPKSGALAAVNAWTTSAAWGDFDHDGKLDLFLGCLRGSNRFFRGKGNGEFEDATEAIGLTGHIFNTQAVTLLDLNADGFLDVVFNNEGQDSVVLLGNPIASGKKIPVAIHVPGKQGLLGSRVEIQTKDGKRVSVADISGGEGRGGQASPIARFTLDPGTYRVVVRLSNGVTRNQDITVGESPLRAKVEAGGD